MLSTNDNILTIERDNINELYFEYDGNKLVYINDQAGDQSSNSVKEFHSSHGESDYTYDANGNLTSDSGRGITSITYNILNLPQVITFTNGNSIHHYYDAAGTRYKTTYGTRQGAATLASHRLMEQSAEQNASAVVFYSHQYHNGNFEYSQIGNGSIVLQKVHNIVGYVVPNATNPLLSGSTYYYAKDHLGNIRETYQVTRNATSGVFQLQLQQQMQYYPSGLPWDDAANANLQPYKYGGKEFLEMHGLDEYDSEARWYYPALMCTTTMDPLCEKYYSTSPYAWCGNNPVNLTDSDGRQWTDRDGNPIKDHSGIKVYLFYNPEDFLEQTMKMAADYEKIYGRDLWH